MGVIQSKINKQSPDYQKNYELMLGLCNQLKNELKKSLFQGEQKYIDRYQEAGKLLARERIELLLDKDSPFLELMPLAGFGIKGNIALGGTMVCGLGIVSGVLCLITANVGTIKGGSIDYTTLQKSFRINEIAMENELPIINLVESAGANLPEQAKIFNYGGITFREITRRSEKGIPTISVVFGNSTAGGAYIPGMSDYTVMVKKQAQVFLAGPPLVKMATKEIVDEESLGGAEMHSKISGVSDYLAENEYHAIRICREILATFKHQRKIQIFSHSFQNPIYDPDEILGIVQADIKKPFDIRELIARIVDGSYFTEFKPDYGSTLVTGYAEICGYPVGILGNNGVLFSESANKGTQFIQLCNRQNRPLLFLQNITGFMVGKQYEQNGIIKHGANMINAVANSKVPALTIIVGSSYGAGNYAMCGRAYNPRFLFTYPNSRIAVMGPEQLSGVMEIIQRDAAAKANKPIDEQQIQMTKMMISHQVESESNAFYATGQLWDEGIIDPRQTRNYLAFCLAAVYNKPFEGTSQFGVFRM